MGVKMDMDAREDMDMDVMEDMDMDVMEDMDGVVIIMDAVAVVDADGDKKQYFFEQI